MDDRTGMLRELQELDLKLEELTAKVARFAALYEELEEPAAALEQEVATLRTRLQEMRLEERRLEHSADDRRARTSKLQERLRVVRNLREEAAVQAELDLLRRALEAEEQEALTLLDQIRKVETRLEQAEEALATARAEIEPRRAALREEEEAARAELARAQVQRERFAAEIPRRDLQSYERIRGGGRSVAVATLTPDGACGNCFSVVPLQLQNEIRMSGKLLPCEACGVLLSADKSS